MTIAADLSNLAFTAGGVNTAGYMFRNRIINGDMRIDQRNSGASSSNAGAYTVDRWKYGASQSGKFTWQQSAGAVTPPPGYNYYLGFTSSSAYTVLATDYFNVWQSIEGYNIADLAWGTANAKTITVSFWVYSSLTGTFGGAITNSASNRSYPFSYTISTANTWSQKFITINGDTSGTWASTNGGGLYLIFSLGTGSNYQGTAGAWVGADRETVTGETQVVSTSGATWYITGVQLETGSIATPFERRPFGMELALCQRYYHRVVPLANYAPLGVGRAYSTTAGNVSYYLPVSMRSSPTVTYSALSDIDIVPGGAATAITNDAATLQAVKLGYTKSGLTSGGIYIMEFNTNLSAWLAFSSEL